MKKLGISVTFLLLVFLILLIAAWIYRNINPAPLPTYFTYSKEEILPLSNLSSLKKMSAGNLKKWDEMMFELIKSNNLGDAYAARVYAYLYTAQRDAAFLSYNTKKEFMGSLDPINGAVLCLFFINDCTKIQFQVSSDLYSEKLAAIVLSKVRMRKEEDVSTIRPNELVDKLHWAGVRPYFGEEVGSFKTWIIKNPHPFLPARPPNLDSKEWQIQQNLTETALRGITPEQIKLVVFWAGNPSTVTPPGIWLKFANQYMEKKPISFARFLMVRSVLSMGLADTLIATFHAKYTYWIKRPNMINPNLHTLMPTPNHPSYPAGHSGVSGASAAILSYYFPENSQFWWKKANEASSSRVWGGIHFQIDTTSGIALGKKIGTAVIQAQSQVE